MNSKKSIILLILVPIFIFGCQPEEQIEIIEAMEESAGSGFLSIETSPSDADIFMDNIYSGKSPITLNNVVVGSHDIVIKKEGYEDFISEVKIEAGRKTFMEAGLVLIPTIEEKPEAIGTVEEEKEEKQIETGTLKSNGIVNLGNKFSLYYDLSEGKFTKNRQLDSDTFSKRYDQHIVFTRFQPANIKVIDKNIDDVKKEDCSGIKGQFEFLFSGQSLCIITKENEIAAIGGEWDDTENAKLTWKLFS